VKKLHEDKLKSGSKGLAGPVVTWSPGSVDLPLDCR